MQNKHLTQNTCSGMVALVILRRLPSEGGEPAARTLPTAAGEPMSRNKKGFTLIELLIVVVIIGILAAIAIPKFANTKDKAYVAAMKSDLRNLATYEEQYAADQNGAYFSGNGSAQGFVPSTNVTITATTAAGPPM